MPEYIVNCTCTIKDALRILESVSSKGLTLFVVDDENHALGSLTDGDVRRGLIQGCILEDKVTKVMNSNFRFLRENFSVTEIKRLKKDDIRICPILNSSHQIQKVVNLREKISYLPIDAVLMAGGKGERLRPLTEKTPKPLVPLGDKTIIDHNIDRLISYGVEDINVTVNYLGNQIEEHFEHPRKGIKVKTFREPTFLGTMGSILFVDSFHHDTILVMNSDIFTNIDFEDFYLHFIEHDADMSVAAVPYNVNIPFGIFELDGREIVSIKEKPSYHYYANAGIYLFKKEVLRYIPTNTFFNATDLIEKLIENSRKVIRFPLTGYWIDIGRHEEYNKAKEIVKHISV